MTTKTELIAAQTEAAIAAGADPLGDNDPLENLDEEELVEDDAHDDIAVAAAAEAAAVAGAADEGAAAAAADADVDPAAAPADELSEEALAAIVGDDEPRRAFRVDDKDFKGERTKLRDQEDAIEAKWTAGELTDGERNKQIAELRDQRDELTRQQTRAETLIEMNRQSEADHQNKILTGIAAQSKKAGQLDYSNPKVGAAYDAMLGAVAADPDNAGKKFAELAQMAHEGLCAVRGIKAAPVVVDPAAAAAATAAAKAAGRKPPAAPITLRDMPAAATPNTGGNALDAIANLSGQAYQDAFSKLSPAQQKALVDG